MNFESGSRQNTTPKKQETKEVHELFHKYIHKVFLSGTERSLQLENNIWLAPLAGITDISFRTICKQSGKILIDDEAAAPGLVFTEMISAKGVHYKGNNSIRLSETDPREGPVSVQIFGSEPDIMAESAALFRERGAPAIDINMGCPMQKITSNGEGSALLQNPLLVEKIVYKTVHACGLPVTVKMRRGYTTGNEICTEAARAAESGGAAAVTVHGRYRDQYYSGQSDLKCIAKVKQSIKIPVIGNGDIDSAAAALKMFETTGCDGIMIGRAALGRPWIFAQLLNKKSEFTITPAEMLNIIKRHVQDTVYYKGEKQGIQEMRKHLAWYTKGLHGAAAIRDQIFKTTAIEEAEELLDRYFTAELS